MASRRGAMKVNPVTGKMEPVGDIPKGKHRDGSLLLDDKYINAAKDLGLGGDAGMYAHLTGLKRMGAADIPVGSSIESAADERARAAAAAAPRATVDATDTEAVKDAIKTHVTATAGGGRIAGFGPTAAAAGSGIHSGPDAFHKRKGVVNTFGGAKDVTREAKAPPTLPPRGAAPPGAHVVGLSSLDAHAAEGKAKRAAAEAGSATLTASAAAARAGGIAGFSKTGGIAVIKKAPGAAPAGGAVASAAGRALAASGGARTTAASAAAAAKTMATYGGHGVLGTGGAAPATAGAAAGAAAGGSGSAPPASAPPAAAAPPPGSDAERRAAYFRRQIADKAAKTAAAVELLKGGEDKS